MKTKKAVSALALLLCVCLLATAMVGCNSEGSTNCDGEIGGKGVLSYTADSIVESVGSGAIFDRKSSVARMDVDSSEEGYVLDGEEDYTQEQINAGMLTGAEWCDNDHWKDFTSKLEGQDSDTADWMSIAKKWRFVATKRLHVHIANGDKAVSLATVELLDGNGKALWNAVSDNNGDAYLFWNTDPTEQSATPVSVRVTAKGGETTTTALEGIDLNETLEVALAAENGDVKLDLMLMVDTTGSMSDELEYLKAELEDVVKRVKTDCQIDVRTSVNFYRDEGDDYVVRYFGFKDDLEDAVSNIQAQSANGGGDYPEAVHTALDNAINSHAWNEDAVKLMILVLDAPPHEESDVIDSLTSSIAKAAEMGIRIIPVASSGIDEECQVLLRTWAAMTGGTYTYLTDHSGIGNHHEKQDVEEETVEPLNDMLVRIISDYCTVK